DLQRVLPYDDALDQQLQESLLVGQGRVLQPATDALAKRLQVSPDFLSRAPLTPQARELLALGSERLATTGELLTALFQLRQIDDFGLVGVEQAPLLAIEPPQLPLPFLVFGPLCCRLILGLPGEGLELLQKCGRVVEQSLDVPPDRGIEFVGLDA